MVSRLRSKPAGVYEFLVSLGAAALLPLLGLPAFALLQWLFVISDGAEVAFYNLVRAFELILPLSAGLAAAHLMTIEQDAGIAELRMSYPESVWRLPVARTFVGLVLSAGAVVLGGLAFRPVFGPLAWGELVTPALAPAFMMVGLSLLAGNLTGSYWLAAALVMGYWFLEIQTRGDVTDTLFLFQYAWPVETVDYALNRRLLAGLGALLLLLNAALSAYRKRGKGTPLRGNR
jgi:hypothetical protein